MTKMHRIHEVEHRGRRRRRRGPPLIVAVLVAVVSMALAAPALAVEPPTVTKVEPAKGPVAGGTTVTITGTNFAGATAVRFGSTNAASFTVNSETSITAVSPPWTSSNGAAEVTVTNAGGTSQHRIGDTFFYEPTVERVEPNTGPSGTSVMIFGIAVFAQPENGGGESVLVVKFGSTQASITGRSEASITAVAPPGTGTVDVTVTTGGGTSATSSADQFTYLEPPTVTKVEPNHGSPGGGTTVTITGTGFTGASAVKFGATSARSFTVNSATSITAVSPKGKGTVDVTVTTPGGTSATSSADQFTFSKK